MMHAFGAIGGWNPDRGTNMLDTGAFFYEVYETADNKQVSFGSIEPQFYRELLRLTGLADDVDGKGPTPAQMDRESWPAMKERLAAVIRTKSRDEWCRLMEGTDVCFAPVLTMAEAPHHPHNAHRATFAEVAGVVQPAPAPRFSRTPGAITSPPPHAGQHTGEGLGDWGFTEAEIAKLMDAGAIK
jgi:alpha-methylacyl-CoA racemase